MAVYVDTAKLSLGRMVCCHMVADTAAELHDMAARIGMRRQWYQCAGFPHYDVARARRAKAVELGAISIDRRRLYEIIKAHRAQVAADPAFAASWAFNAGMKAA